MKTKPTTSRSKLMTVKDVAAELQMTEKFVRDLLRRTQIRGSKIGSDWRVHPDDLDAFVNRNANRRTTQRP